MEKVFTSDNNLYSYDNLTISEADQYYKKLLNKEEFKKNSIYTSIYRYLYFKSLPVRILNKISISDYIMINPNRLGLFYLGLWIGLEKNKPYYAIEDNEDYLPITNLYFEGSVCGKNKYEFKMKSEFDDHSEIEDFINNIYPKFKGSKNLYFDCIKSDPMSYVLLGMLFIKLGKKRKYLRLIHSSKDLDDTDFMRINSFIKSYH
jgi:hypothetical protein